MNINLSSADKIELMASRSRIPELVEQVNAVCKERDMLRHELAAVRGKLQEVLNDAVYDERDRLIKELAETRDAHARQVQNYIRLHDAVLGEGCTTSDVKDIEAIAREHRQQAKFPDIGPDPLKLDGGERCRRLDDEATFKVIARARDVQQPGVPDQTALVWRRDLMNVCDRVILAEARLEFARKHIAKLSNNPPHASCQKI